MGGAPIVQETEPKWQVEALLHVGTLHLVSAITNPNKLLSPGITYIGGTGCGEVMGVASIEAEEAVASSLF